MSKKVLRLTNELFKAPLFLRSFSASIEALGSDKPNAY
jgi:hypothetical protein